MDKWITVDPFAPCEPDPAWASIKKLMMSHLPDVDVASGAIMSCKCGLDFYSTADWAAHMADLLTAPKEPQ